MASGIVDLATRDILFLSFGFAVHTLTSSQAWLSFGHAWESQQEQLGLCASSFMISRKEGISLIVLTTRKHFPYVLRNLLLSPSSGLDVMLSLRQPCYY